MSMKDGIKWVGALGLLIGGGALLVADSMEPLADCDDVASLERSYAVAFSCELSDGEVTERSGILELEYRRVQRFDRTEQYERNDELRYVHYEDWIIGLSQREDLEIDGEEISLRGIYFYPNASECTADGGGTATIDSLNIEFQLQREGMEEGDLEIFSCTVDENTSGLVNCEYYDYFATEEEAELPDCTLTVQEI